MKSMKQKTIKKILSQKINTWVESIKDDVVKNLVQNNTIVMGGALVSMLSTYDSDKPVKDYDIYFRDKETVLAVANYYVNLYKQTHPDIDIKVHDCSQYTIKYDNDNNINYVITSCKSSTGEITDEIVYGVKPFDVKEEKIKIVIGSQGVVFDGNQQVLDEAFEDIYDVLDEPVEEMSPPISNNMGGDVVPVDKYKPVFFSSNAITLSNKIQLVIRFYGDPEKIHTTYDYVSCTNYWTSWNNQLVLNPEALESIRTHELYYKGSKYPLCSIIRMRKFIKRGWTISAGTILKMCWDLNALDLTNIDVLEDQLIGVDSTYFNILIRALQEKLSKDLGFKIMSNYLFSIIDKIF
jgi:hypothetical protein